MAPVASECAFVLKSGVFNPHQNWKQMRSRLDQGSNVAMAFSDRKHLPETVLDHESGKTYRVIDGDTHDFRPLDHLQGHSGVIVGLRNKNKKDPAGEPAVHAQNGFFVHYDPQAQRVRDPNNKKRMLSVPTNTQVGIHPQRLGMREVDNDAVPGAAMHNLIRRRAWGGSAFGHITEQQWSPEAHIQQFPHAHLYMDDD